MKLWWKKKPKITRRRAVVGESEEGLRFRRSATLTGSRSEQVKTANEDRSQLQTARLEAQAKRKKQHRRLRRLGVLLCFILFTWTLLANRITSYEVQVADENISRLPDSRAYIETAKQFAGPDLKNHFTFSLRDKDLSQYLIAKHQEISSVTVERGLFDASPTLRLRMRHPVLIWQTRQDQQAFYVDSNGVTFAHNAFGGDEQLVQVNDQSGVPAELGSPVASSRQIRFLGQFVGQVVQTSEGKITVAKIVFPPSSTKQIDVHLTGRNFYSKVYLERPAKAQAEQLVQTVQYLDSRAITPAEYIDVRIADRIYYK